MTPDDLRFWFCWAGVFALSLYKIGNIIYRRGRQSVLREHFSFTLPRDDSRERL